MSNEISVIIPVAGVGRRMKSYGPKCLFHLFDGRTILRRQIDIIKSSFDKPEIIIVVGFDAEKIIKVLPSDIKIVENEKFEETGVSRSISMGLRASSAKKSIIVYGDLVFDQNLFNNIPNESSIWIDSKDKIDSGEVGLTKDNNYAVHFDYGLTPKWCSIMLLMDNELELYKNLGSLIENRKLAGHEILNEIINRGGTFKCFEAKKNKLIEIDSNKDLEKVKKYLK